MERLLFVDPSLIDTNPDQPRKHFDETQLQGLADSIAALGFIQPLVVQNQANGRYRLVAGERRLRAAKLARLGQVPVVIKNKSLSSQEALAENLQREDLNPIETSRALQKLLSTQAISQDVLARQLGMSRTSLTNFIRLLSLPQEIQKMLEEKQITLGHAKVLLSIEDPEKQLRLAQTIVGGKVSVRQAEREAKKTTPVLQRAASELTEKLGTRVTLNGTPRGQIVIDYFSLEDLERILLEMDIELC